MTEQDQQPAEDDRGTHVVDARDGSYTVHHAPRDTTVGDAVDSAERFRSAMSDALGGAPVHGPIVVHVGRGEDPAQKIGEAVARVLAQHRLGLRPDIPEHLTGRARAEHALTHLTIGQVDSFLHRVPTPNHVPGGRFSPLAAAVAKVAEPWALAQMGESLAGIALSRPLPDDAPPELIAKREQLVEAKATMDRSAAEEISTAVAAMDDRLLDDVADLFVPGWREQ